MEIFVSFVAPAVLILSAIRLCLAPLNLALKLLINGVSGMICLWLLNLISGFTGILFPINAVTILIAGFLGLPGIAMLAVVQHFIA